LESAKTNQIAEGKTPKSKEFSRGVGSPLPATVSIESKRELRTHSANRKKRKLRTENQWLAPRILLGVDGRIRTKPDCRGTDPKPNQIEPDCKGKDPKKQGVRPRCWIPSHSANRI